MGQKCESCAFIMTKPEDHGEGNPKNARCKNCCHPDGTHKTREELFESTVQWLLSDSCSEMGFPKAQTLEEARERAESILLEQPVWQ